MGVYDGFDRTTVASVSMTINDWRRLQRCWSPRWSNNWPFRAERSPADRQEIDKISSWALENIRGTVQADILKEDQGQNTCIFSTEFALKMMGDIQQYFIDHRIRNFYSVSISGYHIAEAAPTRFPARVHAGQRFHLRRDLPGARHAHRRFRPQPVVFFSNGMDPEYTVMGRVPPHLGHGDERQVRRQRAP